MPIDGSIKGRVISVVARFLERPEDGIVPNSSFKELGVDSLSSWDLWMSFEEEFRLEISEEEAKQMNTVGDVIAIISQRLNPS